MGSAQMAIETFSLCQLQEMYVPLKKVNFPTVTMHLQYGSDNSRQHSENSSSQLIGLILG